MSVNVKNYTEQGGEKTIIGGTLEFLTGARVINFPSSGGEFTPAEGEFYCDATTFNEFRNFFNDFIEALGEAGILAIENEKPEPLDEDVLLEPEIGR